MLNIDKLYHFIAGVLLYLLGGHLLVMAGAVGKELYDYASRKGTVDAMDFIVTIVGGLWISSLHPGHTLLGVFLS